MMLDVKLLNNYISCGNDEYFEIWQSITFFICAEVNNISAAKLSQATPSNFKLIILGAPKKVLDKICQNWSKYIMHGMWVWLYPARLLLCTINTHFRAQSSKESMFYTIEQKVFWNSIQTWWWFGYFSVLHNRAKVKNTAD